MWSPLHLIFYVFGAIALGAALIVITSRHPVKSVLSLIVVFFAMAGIWMMLQAEFLSLILLLVYVGAVMTLFLFVVMMLHVDTEPVRVGFVRYFPLSIFVVLLSAGLIVLGIESHYIGQIQASLPPAETVSNIQQVGEVLYTNYAYPFEIAGVLLLVAIIAAITLTHRKPRRLVQHPSKQIAARPEDRVRLVKMPTEKNYPTVNKRGPS